jgi:hypothetical protein
MLSKCPPSIVIIWRLPFQLKDYNPTDFIIIIIMFLKG